MRGSASSAARSTASASSATAPVDHSPIEGSLEPVERGAVAAGARRAGELVLVGDRAASAARAAIAATPGVGEVGAVGVADPAADPGAHPDPALGRRGEALDLAAVDAHLAPRVLGA